MANSTYENTIMDVTRQYLDSLTATQIASMQPQDVTTEILERTAQAIELENQIRPKGQKWKHRDALFPMQVVMILFKRYHVISIDMLVSSGGNADSEQTLLAMYSEEKGIYVSQPSEVRNLIREYSPFMDNRKVEEVCSILHDMAPIRKRCEDPDLVAVNNGIFNYKTKALMPFSPDYVFTAKSTVDYNPNAANVVIHNPVDNTDWDVVSWMDELSDDSEIVDLLWKLIGATLRPFVPWNKAAWFYSEQGNNGKGTLCSLIKNLLGQGAYTTIALSDFSKDFILESLVRATAIITDENDVGVFIDKAANLKAIITGDSILINRKFKNSVSYMFRGMMIQCVNELPRVKDKSESFYRRQLVVPFEKCFTGVERKYIKDDYLKRPEVLEYVMFKVLNMDYYELPEPQACIDTLQAYRSFNDPVRQFVDEILPQCRWDLLPYGFLYDLYKAWFARMSPGGQVQSRNTFIASVRQLVTADPTMGWDALDNSQCVRSAGKMDCPEPLILTYKLNDWKNQVYTGGDPDQICTPTPCEFYRGLRRR